MKPVLFSLALLLAYLAGVLGAEMCGCNVCETARSTTDLAY